MKLFLSYRRDDCTKSAEQIRELLEKEFGEQNVYMDTHDVPVGEDFRTVIGQKLQSCDALLIIIGAKWLNLMQKYTHDLSSPGHDDWVFMEISTAIINRTPIIPILVDGAIPPLEKKLPDPLKNLSRFQFIDISSAEKFQTGINHLINGLHKLGTGNRLTIKRPMIFMSGSMKSNNYDGKENEIERFRRVCRSIGRTIGRLGFGIVGCKPHFSRVLASEQAIIGLHDIDPSLPTTTARMAFPLDQKERERFAALASAAVFVGGSSGTLKEYKICVSAKIKPLIPVGYAGGTGEKLAADMIKNPSAYFNQNVNWLTKMKLSTKILGPNSVAKCIKTVLSKHQIRIRSVDNSIFFVEDKSDHTLGIEWYDPNDFPDFKQFPK